MATIEWTDPSSANLSALKAGEGFQMGKSVYLVLNEKRGERETIACVDLSTGKPGNYAADALVHRVGLRIVVEPYEAPKPNGEGK